MFWKKSARVSTDQKTIDHILGRAVASVIPRDLAQKKLASGERLRVYLGIDPTGAKLHLGHSVPLRKLKALSEAGHQVIFLVGSFTAMIGDPTGRDTAREPLTTAQVEENFQTYKKQAQKILDFSKVEVRYNAEWLAPLTLEGLVKIASNFTVGQMIEREMFDRRLKEGKPISLHEFLYPLMVGYDSVMLYVDCELGGSDQEFNMLAGRTLQKAFGKREKFVLTTRLIEGTDGRKMSKTYDNCVYIEDSPTDMYGKLMSIHDNLIAEYFECATEVPMDEVTKISSALTDGSLHPKDAKMRLAKEIVSLYHGKSLADKAEANFVSTFSKGEVPKDVSEIHIQDSLKISDLVEAKIISSNTEARRLLEDGAIRIAGTDEKITDLATVSNGTTLRVGKHRFVKIVSK